MAIEKPVLDYSTNREPPALTRHMGLAALIIFGVGDMIGAGIYGTIGKAAGLMGNAVWIAFVMAMCAAVLTGLSYASIASRYPRAAGAAYVTQRAFGVPLISYVIGLAVCASGLTSMAATTNVFTENIQAILPPLQTVYGRVAIIFGFLGFLTFVNFWGIRESIWLNAVCAAVEVGGLLFVIFVGMRFWGSVDYFQVPTGKELGPTLMLSGAVLTFFAFIGFEDMLNVSEEVKDPERTMPWGMVTAIGIVTILYISVAVTAVSVVPFSQLADSKNGAPFTQITRTAAPWLSPWVFTFITLFAVTNTSLINYIMGSRLVYGMSRQGLLPAFVGKVHAARRTPHVAICMLGVIVLLLATTGNVTQLASATSLLLLNCFAVVNAALIVLKNRAGEPRGRFEVPTIIPALGVLVCGGLIAGRLTTAYYDGNLTGDLLTTAIMFAAILALYAIVRPKNVGEET
jgi:amino acid transporter